MSATDADVRHVLEGLAGGADAETQRAERRAVIERGRGAVHRTERRPSLSPRLPRSHDPSGSAQDHHVCSHLACWLTDSSPTQNSKVRCERGERTRGALHRDLAILCLRMSSLSPSSPLRTLVVGALRGASTPRWGENRKLPRFVDVFAIVSPLANLTCPQKSSPPLGPACLLGASSAPRVNTFSCWLTPPFLQVNASLSTP